MAIVNTKVDNFLSELSAGILTEKLGHILSKAAEAATVNRKQATVSMTLTLKPVGESSQVIVSAKLANSVPTKRGKSTEDDTTDTPMFVGIGGEMTIDQPRVEESDQYALSSEKDGRPLNKVSQINKG